MKVSAIVPVYNVEKYLRQCVDSLLSQTVPFYEILLVDDGSKDHSGAICDEYAAQHDNVRVVHKRNAGLGMARNTGLDNVTGDFVAFVDSDDYLEPDWLEVMTGAMAANRVDVCKSGFQRVLDDGTILSSTHYTEEIFSGDEIRTVYVPRMTGSCPEKSDSLEMNVTCALYKMAYIREHNLRFLSERVILSEDLPFNMDYAQYADGACVIAYIGYNYRTNDASLTRSYRADRFERSCYFYQQISDKLVALGYGEETLVRLRRLFFIYIKMCVAQESRAVSGLSSKQSLANIRAICRDENTVGAIAAYPVRKLGLKQRAFVYMLKLKAARLLYLCANKGMI